MDLEGCILLLRNASSDNERMAALLLVGKMVKSGEIGQEGRRKVFDAVGFTFINRLLSTRDIPEGCQENAYHNIAVTILACFCTDPELALHPQITSKTPLFNDFISKQSSVAEDSLQCLQAISATPSGLQHLMRYNTIEVLAKCYLKQGHESVVYKDLLLHVLSGSSVATEMAEPHGSNVASMLSVLAEEFKMNQDALKFEVCDLLFSVLSLVGPEVVLTGGDVSWLRCVATGLRDILSSKLDSGHRNSALLLSSLLCHFFGVEWAVTVDGTERRTFFNLLVHLVTVETRMALECREFGEILEDSTLISSCFVIIEQAIIYTANVSELPPDQSAASVLDQEDLLQLHTTLTEALTSVVHFLHTLESIEMSTLLSHPVVVAAVRVLGAWLAEESLVLSEEVYKLLPFLLKLCGRGREAVRETEGRQTAGKEAEGREVGSSEDVLKFLLPGLCHLTAEDKPRRLLLKADLQKTVLEYIQGLCSRRPLSSDAESGVSLCCGVLMNVCVCEAEVVRENETFTAIATFLMQLISEGVGESDSFKLNVILLFLMVARRQGIERLSAMRKISVWHAVLEVVLRICPHLSALGVSSPHGGGWREVSELWYLAMQELAAIAKTSEEVKQMAADSPVMAAFTEMFRSKGEQTGAGNEDLQSIVSAIGTLLKAMTSQM